MLRVSQDNLSAGILGVFVMLVVVGFSGCREKVVQRPIRVAGWEFEDTFSGLVLDDIWTPSFPATEDGYFKATGRATAVTYVVGKSHLTVSAITGGSSNHLWNLTCSVKDVGASDFIATLDMRLPWSVPDMGRYDLKLVDSDGYIIAGGMVVDISAFDHISLLDTGFNYTASVATPKDLNNSKGVLYRTLPVFGRVARMTISRKSNQYTLTVSTGADYDHLAQEQSHNLGNSDRLVESLQLTLGYSGDSQTTPLVVDRVSMTSLEPKKK